MLSFAGESRRAGCRAEAAGPVPPSRCRRLRRQRLLLLTAMTALLMPAACCCCSRRRPLQHSLADGDQQAGGGEAHPLHRRAAHALGRGAGGRQGRGELRLLMLRGACSYGACSCACAQAPPAWARRVAGSAERWARSGWEPPQLTPQMAAQLPACLRTNPRRTASALLARQPPPHTHTPPHQPPPHPTTRAGAAASLAVLCKAPAAGGGVLEPHTLAQACAGLLPL